jgi:hypothetical protein
MTRCGTKRPRRWPRLGRRQWRCRLCGRLEMRKVCARKLANFFELVHSNGFNSPSMVGINSVTVG